MPFADAGAGLPRFGAQPVGKAAFDILDQRLPLERGQLLGGQHDIGATGAPGSMVIEMGDRLQPDGAERHPEIVEIDEIGIVALDQCLLPRQPARDEARIGGRRKLHPPPAGGTGPGVHLRPGGKSVGGGQRLAGVQLLRVEAVPPFAPAIGDRQSRGVITLPGTRSFGIVVIGNLIPVPRMARMIADAEA